MEELLFFVAIFCVTSYALLEHVSISIPIFSMVKMPILVIGGFCLMTKVKLLLANILKKRYFYILAVLILLCAGLLSVAFLNQNVFIGTNPVRQTVRLVLFLLELFWLMIWVAETGKVSQIINFLFWYMLILVLVTDVFLFTKVIVFYSGKFENYLVGTKFSVSYLHMDLLTIWFVRNNMRLHREGKTKLFVFLATLFVLAVSIRVDCMTGAIGCVALCVLFLLLNTSVGNSLLRFQSPVFLSLFLLGSVIFPFIAERLLSIPLLERLVTDVFGRDNTLTGRLGIFETFFDKMTGHWLQGYGYGNGNTAAEWLFRCANAQNALLQWVLEVGASITALLVGLILLVFKQLSKGPEQKQILPLVALVYVYVILGTVETTFSMSFILWIALIFMYVNAKEPETETEEPEEM